MIRFAPLLMIVCLAILSGCAKTHTNHNLEGLSIPYSGQALSPELAEGLESLNPAVPQAQSRILVFPLPSVMIFRNFSNLRPDGVYAATSFTWWDMFLGSIGISLPLFINYNDYHYAPGQAEPVGHRRAFYSPLWANSSSNVAEGALGMNIEASGIPLLWTRARFSENSPSGESGSLTKYGFLWTLGPAVLKIRSSDDSTRGYFAAPLLLGGLPGALLWSDYHLHQDGAHRIGHGPVMGLLGYHQSDVPAVSSWIDEEGVRYSEITEHKFLRYIIAGILWEDLVRTSPEGEKLRSSHGPLWGMFGWGSKEGDFTLRLLWMSVRF